jgi:carboxymethylenebutenolidase
MCDEFIHAGLIEDPRISRRTFGLVTAAAAAVATTGAFAQANAVEKDVEVKTSDGTCDAVLFYPEGQGTWPGVLIWTDIAGLRPVFRDMGRRLASEGYVVLVPNPFYRSAHAPVISGRFDFNDAAQRNRLFSYRDAITDDGAARDAQAYLGFIDAQPQTDKNRKAGVQGYCMGGALTFRTAAAMPTRIAAVGSFHGGNGLVTDKPDSPHLLIPKTNATFVVCQAQNDDKAMPQVKDVLKATFAAAHRPAAVEVYHANHGWCVPGGAAYNQAEAERAWTALGALYKSQLS